MYRNQPVNNNMYIECTWSYLGGKGIEEWLTHESKGHKRHASVGKNYWECGNQVVLQGIIVTVGYYWGIGWGFKFSITTAEK